MYKGRGGARRSRVPQASGGGDSSGPQGSADLHVEDLDDVAIGQVQEHLEPGRRDPAVRARLLHRHDELQSGLEPRLRCVGERHDRRFQ